MFLVRFLSQFSARLTVAFMAIFLSSLAWAQASGTTRVGQYIVEHSALPTEFMIPEVAARYDQPRGPNLGLLTLSVRPRSQNFGFGIPMESISGITRNIIGHTRQLQFRPVQEGEATYYVADFPTGGERLLRFQIEVIPPAEEGAELDTLEMSFSYRP